MRGKREEITGRKVKEFLATRRRNPGREAAGREEMLWAQKKQQEEKMNLWAERQRREEERAWAKQRQLEAAAAKKREEFEKKERKKLKQKEREKMEMQRERDEYETPNRHTRQDRRMPERERGIKRRTFEVGRYSSEYSQSSKRRRGGEANLSKILEAIVDKLRGQTDVSFLFVKPVSKKEAPDYSIYVHHPMDLTTIKQKVKRLDYKSRDEFRQDVALIADNAHTYNDGRNPGIPPLADQLLAMCDDLLETFDGE